MNKWLREIHMVLEDAQSAIDSEESPSENLYMLAPLFYSKHHNINNQRLLDEMSKSIDELVKSDWLCDEQLRENYRFQFVSAYLFCFVVADKLSEIMYEQIIDFISSELDLFGN